MTYVALVADYSWGRPGAANLKAAGFIGSARYVSPKDNGAKNCGMDEVQDHAANGACLILVWETTANRPRDGFDAGYQDAIQANAFADELGYPTDLPIFYADDENNKDPDTVMAYYAGAWSAQGRVPRMSGPYGSFEVLEAIGDAGYGPEGWQVETWTVWDGNTPRISKYAVMVQLPNASHDIPNIDVNGVTAGFRAWWPGGGGPDTKPVPQEDELTFIIQDDKETGFWVSDGIIKRPTNAPQRYLDMGCKLVTDMSEGEFNELRDVRETNNTVVALVADVDEAKNAIKALEAEVFALRTGGVDPAVVGAGVAKFLAGKLGG